MLSGTVKPDEISLRLIHWRCRWYRSWIDSPSSPSSSSPSRKLAWLFPPRESGGFRSASREDLFKLLQPTHKTFIRTVLGLVETPDTAYLTIDVCLPTVSLWVLFLAFLTKALGTVPCEMVLLAVFAYCWIGAGSSKVSLLLTSKAHKFFLGFGFILNQPLLLKDFTCYRGC